MTASLPKFTYADDFDKEHHKIQDWMIDTLIDVHRLLKLKDGESWSYTCTLHGVLLVFTGKYNNRLSREVMLALHNIKSLRYVEARLDSFVLALTEQEIK